MNAFALNHIVAPRLDAASFFALAKTLGIAAVEIRNDLAGVPLADGASPASVREQAATAGVRIVSVNALQRFNDWSPTRAAEAEALAAAARASGAEALVLCPVNEAGWREGDDARNAALDEALINLAPILERFEIVGLVEPLGFAECSLRFKRDAVAAIDRVGRADRFRLVHDTFHHFVAGETETFPARTGLVHVSGVEDPGVPREAMRDGHRALVTERDRIDNVGQIKALVAGGYDGVLSFEPFAAEVANDPAIADSLRASIAIIERGLRAEG